MPPFPLLRVAVAALALVGASTQPASAAPDDLVTVIVKLDEEPVATYRGTIRGLAATSAVTTGARRLDPRSAAVLQYRAHLGRKHAAFAQNARTAVPGARVLYDYDMVVGGMAMEVPESAIPTLESLPGVVAVHRDGLMHLDTDLTPTFIGAKAVWGKLGGQDDAGEGVIVGIIDTGIWPEHPSFSDPDPAGKPYVIPPGTRRCDFAGGANPGAPFACNGKLIGAYRFLASYDACGGCAHPAADFSTARDAEGHGTHVASTAAGNGGVLANIYAVPRGTVSGIAPRAHVIAYRACGISTCRGADTTAAVQQAILDGVDVINFSISGGTAPYFEITSSAFLDAYAAGIFIAASAGNTGPTVGSVAHLEGWVTSVAASTDKKVYRAKLTLKSEDGAKLKLAGSTITPGIKEPAPFILAASVGDELCENATADGAFTGMIVGCKRGGTIGRTLKNFNAAERGAVGVVIFNDAASPSQRGTDTDTLTVPGIHVDAAEGTALATFMGAHANVTASFTQGKPAGTRADATAAFSSRGGPNLATGILKPDLAAPGVQILAGDTPEGAPDDHTDGQLFQSISGTSMASPHVAGAAALLRHAHPDWTPGQIKSALMTTAVTKKLVIEDQTTSATPFDRGAGRVFVKAALTPGATFDVPAADFTEHAGELWTVNHPSLFLPAAAPASVTVERTLTSVIDKDVVWKLSVVPVPGLAVSVPAQVTVPARGTATFSITVDKSGLGPAAVAHATLLLKGKSLLHVPITAVGATPLPNLRIASASVSSPLTEGGPITFTRTLENTGAVDAGPNFTYFYLSTDAKFSIDDRYLGYCQRSVALGPGLTSTCNVTGTFTLSPPATPGVYHAVVVTDGDNTVAEGNEGDNVYVAPTTVTVE